MRIKKQDFRILWIGSHMEGIEALESVIEEGYNVIGVITLTPEKAAKKSGSVDYSGICRKYKIPIFYTEDINHYDTIKVIKSLKPDVAFVIGWHQIIKPEVLNIPRLGMIGAHASLLPHNRGSAPINWAIIKGEKVTGNTLMWLSEEVDKGEIIDQRQFPITKYDTCFTLYKKVAKTNKEMILEVLPKLLRGEKIGRKQPYVEEPLLPRRRPKDGLINWNKGATDIYNFIRALTRPYPGAFSFLDGQKWKIWQAALLPESLGEIGIPGEIIDSVVSPVNDACGLLVACEKGGIIILEIENQSGEVIKGKRLSDLPWKGKIWKKTES